MLVQLITVSKINPRNEENYNDMPGGSKHICITLNDVEMMRPLIIQLYLTYTSSKIYCDLCTGNILQWRHNGCDGVSNHQPHDCLLNRLFGHISKKISKLHSWPVNSPHKWPVTRKRSPFNDVIMPCGISSHIRKHLHFLSFLETHIMSVVQLLRCNWQAPVKPTTVADALATAETKVSEAMASTNIPVSSPERFMLV